MEERTRKARAKQNPLKPGEPFQHTFKIQTAGWYKLCVEAINSKVRSVVFFIAKEPFHYYYSLNSKSCPSLASDLGER